MSWMVASCDCLFRFIGGTLSMPLDIACGLDGDERRGWCRVCSAPDDAYGPAQVGGVCVEHGQQLCPLFRRQCFRVFVMLLVDVAGSKGAHLRSQAGRGHPPMRQGSTRRRIRGGRGRDRGRPRRRRGCMGRVRWGWGSGGSRTLSCQPRACQPQGLEISAVRVCRALFLPFFP